ncbi:MAG: Gfo/Idh/MocA family oxidoreductase [Candidatus Buchananbacteria bacterium]
MTKKISVAVVGKSGQAAKIISAVKKFENVNLQWVYYPKKIQPNDLPLTDDFNNIIECDAVIIASPTYTHADYLDKLKNFKGYILVEKPAVSTSKELSQIEKFPDEWKKRLKVNFNFQYSKIASLIGELVNRPELGTPITLNIYTSHGLAFSDKYKGSWRSDLKYSFGVLELVGVHYLNFAISLFGPIKNYQANLQWNASQNNNLPPDTVFLSLVMEKSATVNLFHSYAGPQLNKILLIGTNGYFEYDGKTANLYSPRESYDSQGRFISPPVLEKYDLDWSLAWQESLDNSLADFFKVVESQSEFSLSQLENAFLAAKPIFELREKTK